MRIALVKLVFDAGREIVEPALRVAALGTHLLVYRAESEAKVFRNALRQVQRKIGHARGGAVALARHFPIRDRRQRQLVRNERILRHERCFLEVMRRRRRGGSPFQRAGSPRIATGSPSILERPDQVAHGK